jgi:hypothetical protein
MTLLSQNLSPIKPALIFALFLTPSLFFAQISGTVFRDFNGNGTKENTTSFNEPFIEGLRVYAFWSNRTVDSTLTDANGAYSFSGTSFPARIEFSLPSGDFSAPLSNNSRSNVQKITAATTTAHFAVAAPDDYWNNTAQPIPKIITPCYVNGTSDGPHGSEVGIVQIGNDQNGITGISYHPVALFSEVGTVWGEAYQRSKDRFFFSAFLKRHSGVGARGFGGIYIAEKTGSNYNITGGFSLNNVTPVSGGTMDFGSVTRVQSPDTDDNFITNSTVQTAPNHDIDAFAKVGTVGYGDIDMDETNQKLFMVNTHQGTLVVMDVSGSTTTLSNANATALGALTHTYTIASLPNAPTCTGGSLRAWGLKIYKGVGYLGVVCDANISQNNADLAGFILKFDPNNVSAGFTTVLNLDLDYRSGGETWRPWFSDWAQTGITPTSGGFILASPIISDIEFDENNNLLISIMNRVGNQMSFGNYFPISGLTTTTVPITHGDLLKACYNPISKTWAMEGTGSCAVNFASNSHGYNGTGEFFDDASGDGSTEASMGSMAKIMGTNRMIATIIDPFPTNDRNPNPIDLYWSTGGLHWFDLTTGSWDQHARLYEANWQVTAGKANGLGDLEAALSESFIEIGNTVWADADNDGIQDPNEAGIAGIVIKLYKGNVLIATAETDANGHYLFSSDGSKTSTAHNIYGISDLLANSEYTLRIENFATQPPLSNLTATVTNNGGSDANRTIRDSDGTVSSGNVDKTLTTSAAGTHNYNYDFGFKAICPPKICLSVTAVRQ